jgi:hypothetical protein
VVSGQVTAAEAYGELLTRRQRFESEPATRAK